MEESFLSKTENEVKIAEKLKFWEEQDQINKELIPRVVKNHEMITDLTYQFEKNLSFLANLQSNLEKTHNNFQSDIDNLSRRNSNLELKMDKLTAELGNYIKFIKVLEKQEQEMEEAKLKLIDLEHNLEEMKNMLTENMEGNSKVAGKDTNRFSLINIGVASAIILSIIGILV
jgi:DNA repair exonuclease SbcCD ATPase subunit